MLHGRTRFRGLFNRNVELCFLFLSSFTRVPPGSVGGLTRKRAVILSKDQACEKVAADSDMFYVAQMWHVLPSEFQLLLRVASP